MLLNLGTCFRRSHRMLVEVKNTIRCSEFRGYTYKDVLFPPKFISYRYLSGEITECKYTEDEKCKILAVLNHAEEDELCGYAISSTRLKKILDRRKEKGNFQSIEDVVNMKGLGTKVVEKIWESILDNQEVDKTEPKTTVPKIKGKLVEPTLGVMEKMNIKSVCSLVVDLTYSSWTCVEREGNYVSSWDVYHYEDIETKQLKLSNTMEIVWNICERIPRCDVYVMEAIPTVHRASGADGNNPKAMHINLQKVQLVAMVAAALNTLENFKMNAVDNMSEGYNESFRLPPFRHNVFYLRPLLSSRLFKTFVGNERVSAQSVVESMLSTDRVDDTNMENESIYKQVIQNISPVRFNGEVRQRYARFKSRDKEFMSHTLLLASTFMELCVYENPKAFKNLLNRN